MQTPVTKVRDLTSQLNKWRHEYYNLNAPSVSDAVYDKQFDELKRLERITGFRMSNSPTQTVGYAVVDGLDKTVHVKPLLSLDKTKDMAAIIRFIANHQAMMMHKLDGLTVKLEYENGMLIRASTRGNGDEGEIITHNARAIEGIPERIQYRNRLVVVGEAYITKPVFERLRNTLTDSNGNPYKNSRNMAAGSVRCYDSESCSKRGVAFSPFNVLEGLEEKSDMAISKSKKLRALELLGFSPCTFMLPDLMASEQVLSNMIANLKKIAESDGLPIDGIVVAYDNIPYSILCGRTGHHYKDGLAFKFEDELVETIFRNIEWQPSRFGELSPVAVFDTVEIDGCDVSRASLHNLSFIKDLELVPGCRILVSKRNMIIPHIEENLDRGGYDNTIIPKECPCCSSFTRIDRSGAADVLRCDNPLCSKQTLRKFVHFTGKKAMDIEGLSESILERFIQNGWLNGFVDVYRLDRFKDEIVSLDRFGQKSWERLWSAIQRSRDTTFERYVVAMDIPMIGRTASRELKRYFGGSIDAFEFAVFDNFDFTQLNDFGETLHRNIHQWFRKQENIKFWKELQKMVTIENTQTVASNGNADNPFIGRTVVVTGKLEHFTRDSINTRIEELGAKAGSSVSKNTDFLICGENAGSKLTKARSLGVAVLSEQQFLEMAKTA